MKKKRRRSIRRSQIIGVELLSDGTVRIQVAEHSPYLRR